MNTQFVLDEVERRVAEMLPAALLDRGITIHAKRSFRYGCNCAYCGLKREATATIAAPFVYPRLKVRTTKATDFDEYGDYLRAVRKEMRMKYRKELRSLMKE